MPIDPNDISEKLKAWGKALVRSDVSDAAMAAGLEFFKVIGALTVLSKHWKLLLWLSATFILFATSGRDILLLVQGVLK